jgi:hypothetical protein
MMGSTRNVHGGNKKSIKTLILKHEMKRQFEDMKMTNNLAVWTEFNCPRIGFGRNLLIWVLGPVKIWNFLIS